jgi:hypothetical protein
MNAPARLRAGLAVVVLIAALVACTEDPGAGAPGGPSADPAAATPPAASGAPSAESQGPAQTNEPSGSGGRGDYDY